MEKIFEIFKSREIASFSWLLILLSIGLFNSGIRKSLIQVLKAFFQKSILLTILFSIIYSACITYLLQRLGFWQWNMVKNVIAWFIGSAFIVLMSLTKSNEQGFFRRLLLNNLKILAILQFIMNVHMFSLLVEFIMIPFITLIVGMRAIAEGKDEHIKTVKFLDGLLSVGAIVFLIFSIRDIATDVSKFASFTTLKSFLLPIILSISFIPCAYLISLYMTYKVIFRRLGIFLSNRRNLRYAKWRTLRMCNVSLNRLNKLSSKINSLYNGSTREQIKEVIS